MRYYVSFLLLLTAFIGWADDVDYSKIPELGPDGRMWDIIIVGGGPTGLAAARVARSKHDLTVLLIEKRTFDQVKAAPRGETLDPVALVDEVWGEGFLDDISIKETTTNIFYSPGSKKISYMDLIETPYSFHWENYIGSALKVLLGYNPSDSDGGLFIADEGRLVMVTGLPVTRALFRLEGDEPVIEGVETIEGIFKAHTVFDCSGHNSPIGKALGLNYNEFNMPVMKCEGRVDASKFPYLSFEPFRTFFIPSGTTPELKGAPPAFTMIFPQDRSGDMVHVEVICMLFSAYGSYGKRGPFSPDINEEYLKRSWESIKKSVPMLKEIMAEVSFDYQVLTAIPLKSLVEDEMSFPGLVMLGDAAGFVISSTGSGLITGMEDALWWSGRVAGMKAAGEQWSSAVMRSVNSEFKKTTYYAKVKSANLQTRLVQDIVWGMMVSPEAINFNWGLIMWGYNVQINMTVDRYFKSDEEFMALTTFKQRFILNRALKKTFFCLNTQDRFLQIMARLKESKSEREWLEIVQSIKPEEIYDRFSVSRMEEALSYFEQLSLLDCFLYLKGKGMNYKAGRIRALPGN